MAPVVLKNKKYILKQWSLILEIMTWLLKIIHRTLGLQLHVDFCITMQKDFYMDRGLANKAPLHYRLGKNVAANV